MSTLSFINHIQNSAGQHNIYLQQQQQQQKVPFSSGVFYQTRSAGARPNPVSQKQPAGSDQETSIAAKSVAAAKAMTWGEPTWLFFHTMAIKVREESFAAVRGGVLNLIYTVCMNLPCPDCSVHAKKYLDSNNLFGVRSKAELKRFLYDFHNSLNRRKSVTTLTYEELDQKYIGANTKNIVYYFIASFEKKNKSIRLIADDIHRKLVSGNIKAWINENIQHFDA
jgi:hypothetical protein